MRISPGPTSSRSNGTGWPLRREGGWETCGWTFADGARAVSVTWDGRARADRAFHIVANGRIHGAEYVRYFELPSGTIPPSEVISFLLFALPELGTADSSFTVAVEGRFAGSTPDIDAIGVVSRR